MRGFAPIYILIVLVVLVGGYLAYPKIQAKLNNSSPQPTTSNQVALDSTWEAGTNSYSNSKIDIAFQYPKSFIKTEKDPLKENESFKKQYPQEKGLPYPDEILAVGFNFRPGVSDEERQNIGFDGTFYENNSMGVGLHVSEDKTAASLDVFLRHHYSRVGIDNKTTIYESIKKDLKLTNTPVAESYAYAGSFGGENPTKAIFFAYKGKFYTFTLIGGTGTGVQYSPEAEKVFDKIIASIKLL